MFQDILWYSTVFFLIFQLCWIRILQLSVVPLQSSLPAPVLQSPENQQTILEWSQVRSDQTTYPGALFFVRIESEGTTSVWIIIMMWRRRRNLYKPRRRSSICQNSTILSITIGQSPRLLKWSRPNLKIDELILISQWKMTFNRKCQSRCINAIMQLADAYLIRKISKKESIF